MTNPTFTFDDVYTRKVGGERYRYRLDYNAGAQVTWKAIVYRVGDDDIKGTPSGQIDDNLLEGDALRQQLVSLVEITIENMAGIAE